jgi:protein subunit release factor A
MIEASIKQKKILLQGQKNNSRLKNALRHANSIGAKDAAEQASKELEATKKSNEKTAALVKAYSEWEAAQARANKAAEMGVTTQDEQMQALKTAAQEYQEKLVDITLQYGALGDASSEALRKRRLLQANR